MSILKLKEVGDEATLTITACDSVEGQYGQQVKFDAGEDTVYVPVSSALRQLERIGLDYERCVGQTLHFSRTASNKPGVNYWNINTAKPNGATKPTPKSAPPNPPRTMSSRPTEELPEFLRDAAEEDAADLQKRVGIDTTAIQKDLALYQAITEYVIRDIAPIYEKAKIGMSPESAAAATATLYIQAKRNG